MTTETEIKNNGGIEKEIKLNGWERAMMRGMIRDLKEAYPLSNNEKTWLEILNSKVQE